MGNNTTCGGGGDDDDVPVFSEDVLIQILVWLPVISLLRFKSVCKSWRALIETPHLIDLHNTTTTLKSFSPSSKFGYFIIHAYKIQVFSPLEMFIISSSGADTTGANFELEYLGFPPCSEDSLSCNSYVSMVGSCNGLICIHDKRLSSVTLWNPATRQFRVLPESITIEQPEKDDQEFLYNFIEQPEQDDQEFLYDFVVFGYDVKTKDYKVVQFCCFRPPPSYYLHNSSRGDECFYRIQVYNLSTDSWRLLEGIHCLPVIDVISVHKNQGIYMNGCYFFVGKDESQVWQDHGKVVVCNNSVMYSFDFTKEILTSMQFPDHDSRHDFILTNLGADKMALFMIKRNSFAGRNCGSQFHDCGLDYEYYDIWVLNEQQTSSSGGVVVNKESWTKVHSFPKLNSIKHHTQPRCISNDGEFALISITTPDRSSRLQLFNLVTKEAKEDYPVGCVVFRSDVYNESLVSIIGGNGAAATTTDRVVGGATCSTVAAATTTDRVVGGAMCSTEAAATTADRVVGDAMCCIAAATTTDMVVGGAM